MQVQYLVTIEAPDNDGWTPFIIGMELIDVVNTVTEDTEIRIVQLEVDE